MPSDRAHLRKSKPEAIPEPSGHTVLIEPGRQADRIGEATAKQHLLQTQIAPLQFGRNPLQHGGDPWPVATQTGLPKSQQRRSAQLLRIHALIAGKQGTQPTLVEASRRERLGHWPP